jgi:hypothetical protein
VPNTALLKASVSTLVFGNPKQGFQLHNTGDVDVHVASMVISGPNATSFLVVAPTNFVVHANDKHTVDVDLVGNSIGPAHASLIVQSNAPTVHVTLDKLVEVMQPGPGQPSPKPEMPSNGILPDPSGTGWGAPSGACFAPGTQVLMADGTPRRIEDVAVGDAILAIAERDHVEHGTPEPRAARIERVLRHDGGHALLDVDGIRATAVHRWAVREGGDTGGFLRTDEFVPGSTALRVYVGGAAGWRAAGEAVPSGSAATVYNFTTTARTYLVGARADGPWYVVHNDKPVKPPDDPPTDPPPPPPP